MAGQETNGVNGLPPIYFYISEFCWIPVDIDAALTNSEVALKAFSYGPGCWTLQTYLRLKAIGFPCELVRKLPEKGIVLAHRDCLFDELQPRSKVLLICLQADREHPHPYAQLHVVQNPTHTRLIRNSFFIPLWIQPGLIPRDATRGDRFETVAFFGAPENLAPELQAPAWRKQVAAFGLNWQVRSRDRWHDYSDVDAVIAVRDFEKSAFPIKPATKLFNAWHAGVPAILGRESAFRSECRSQLDYLEATSPEEVVSALQRLRDDQELRRAMVANGQQRAEETHPDRLVEVWSSFLTQVAVPAYERWCRTSRLERLSFLSQRYGATLPQRLLARGVAHEVRHLFTLARLSSWWRSLRSFRKWRSLAPKKLETKA